MTTEEKLDHIAAQNATMIALLHGMTGSIAEMLKILRRLDEALTDIEEGIDKVGRTEWDRE